MEKTSGLWSFLKGSSSKLEKAYKEAILNNEEEKRIIQEKLKGSKGLLGKATEALTGKGSSHYEDRLKKLENQRKLIDDMYKGTKRANRKKMFWGTAGLMGIGGGAAALGKAHEYKEQARKDREATYKRIARFQEAQANRQRLLEQRRKQALALLAARGQTQK